MNIVVKHLTNGQYIATTVTKFAQFLHHTVSTNAMSAWRWWNSTPERVGTPYIIERDGDIYECFDPSVYAYHLGIVGDDNYFESHAISIEIVSAGPLRLEKGEYRFYPLWPNKLRYTVIPKDEVYTFDKPWKGFLYWHKYSDAQINALKELLLKNFNDFKTLKFDNSVGDIFKYDPTIVRDHKPGVYAHCSVRDDKSDIFPYPPLIEMLKEVKDIISGNKETIPNEDTIEAKVAPKTTSKKGTKK